MAGYLKILSGTVSDLTHDGRGVVKVEGSVYFIEGALVGELVSFSFVKRIKKQNIGKLIQVEKKSVSRVEPPCCYFTQCGGCAIQHLSNDGQIVFKQHTLLQNLRRLGNVKPQTILQPLTGMFNQYRRRARFAVQWNKKSNQVSIGFRQRGSHNILSIDSCMILVPQISNLLPILQKKVNGINNKKIIRQLDFTVTERIISLVIEHVGTISRDDSMFLSDWAVSYPELSISFQSDAHHLLTDADQDVGFSLSYTLPKHQICINFGVGSFIQINEQINRKLVDCALELLNIDESDSVIDFFCGVGNFTLPIAKYARQVLGIEANIKMVSQANVNAKNNELPNAIFSELDLYSNKLREYTFDNSYNKVILDPPRAGAKELICHIIPQLRPEIIVYVSCNPATLSRDSDILVNQYGYKLDSVGIIDMFPHTAHVESIALFTLI